MKDTRNRLWIAILVTLALTSTGLPAQETAPPPKQEEKKKPTPILVVPLPSGTPSKDEKISTAPIVIKAAPKLGDVQLKLPQEISVPLELSTKTPETPTAPTGGSPAISTAPIVIENAPNLRDVQLNLPPAGSSPQEMPAETPATPDETPPPPPVMNTTPIVNKPPVMDTPPVVNTTPVIQPCGHVAGCDCDGNRRAQRNRIDAESDSRELIDRRDEYGFATRSYPRTTDDEQMHIRNQAAGLGRAAKAQRRQRAVQNAARAVKADEVQIALLEWYAANGLPLEGAPVHYGTDFVGAEDEITVVVGAKIGIDPKTGDAARQTTRLHFRWVGRGKNRKLRLVPEDQYTVRQRNLHTNEQTIVERVPSDQILDFVGIMFDELAWEAKRQAEANAANPAPVANDVCKEEEEEEEEKEAPSFSSSGVIPSSHFGGGCSSGGHVPPVWARGTTETTPPNDGDLDEPEDAPRPRALALHSELLQIDRRRAELDTAVADIRNRGLTEDQENDLLDVVDTEREKLDERVSAIDEEIENHPSLRFELWNLEQAAETQPPGLTAPTPDENDFDGWLGRAADGLEEQISTVAAGERRLEELAAALDAAASAYQDARELVASNQSPPAHLKAMRRQLEMLESGVQAAAEAQVLQQGLLEAMAAYTAQIVERGEDRGAASPDELIGDGSDALQGIVALNTASAEIAGQPIVDVGAKLAELRARLQAARNEEAVYRERRKAFLAGLDAIAVRTGELVESGVQKRFENRVAKIDYLQREKRHYEAGIRDESIVEELAEGRIVEIESQIKDISDRAAIDQNLIEDYRRFLTRTENEMPALWQLSSDGEKAEHHRRMAQLLENEIEVAHNVQKTALNDRIMQEQIDARRGTDLEEDIENIEIVRAETAHILESRKVALAQDRERLLATNRGDGVGPASRAEMFGYFREQGANPESALMFDRDQVKSYAKSRLQLIKGAVRSDIAGNESYFVVDFLKAYYLEEVPNLINPLFVAKGAVGGVYGAAEHIVTGVVDLGDLTGELVAVNLGFESGGVFGTDKVDSIYQLTEFVSGNEWSTIGDQLGRAAWQGLDQMQRGDSVWNNAKFGGAVGIELVLAGTAVHQSTVRGLSLTARNLERASIVAGKLRNGSRLSRTLERLGQKSAQLSARLQQLRGTGTGAVASHADDAVNPIDTQAVTVHDTGRVRFGGDTLAHTTVAAGRVDPPAPVKTPGRGGHVYSGEDRLTLASFFARTNEVSGSQIAELIHFWQSMGVSPRWVMAGRAFMRRLSPDVLGMSPDQIRRNLDHYLDVVEGIRNAGRRQELIDGYLNGNGGVAVTAATPPPTPPAPPAAAATVFEEPTVILNECQFPLRRVVPEQTSIFDEATVILNECPPLRRAVPKQTSIFDEATVILNECRLPLRRVVPEQTSIFDEATVILNECRAMPTRVAPRVALEPNLFVRVVGSTPDPAYLKNAGEAVELFVAWMQTNGRHVTAEELEAIFVGMHRTMARGKSGKRIYRDDIDHPGMTRADLTAVGDRRKGASREAALEYLRRIAENHPDLDLRIPRASETVTPLSLDGIPSEGLPRILFSGGHKYPDAEFIGAYFARGAALMNEVQKMPYGSRAAFEKIMEYYHLMINAGIFPKINNSLLMSQVNTLLRAKGFPRGMSHGYLDYLAYQLPYDEFIKVADLHAAGRLPIPETYGVGLR